jgi:hypothetical protein
MSKYTSEQFEADRQARQEREAKEEEERHARAEKESARRAWLADGGRAGDFERQWPQLRDEARRRRVADADREARAAQRMRA